MDVEIDLVTNGELGKCIASVCEEIECEDYGAIGRVFERDDAACNFSRLNSLEDI